MLEKSSILSNNPALIAHRGRGSLLTPDGELLDLDSAELLEALRQLPPPVVVHSPLTRRLLGFNKAQQTEDWLDLLELAAFVFPATAFGPTPRGLAMGMNIPIPDNPEADFLPIISQKLCACLSNQHQQNPSETVNALAATLYYAHWNWAPLVLKLLGITLPLSADVLQPIDALKIWYRLPKWEEYPPRPQPKSLSVHHSEARNRLSEMLGTDAEIRSGQTDFVDIACFAFEPRDQIGHPNVVLAEAGTGTGKTLAYIAPASIWAEKNDGSVWVNTYTRHLQRQIENEFRRLYPDKQERHQHIVVRKGRENYLCLLNMEDMIRSFPKNLQNNTPHRQRIAFALISLWAEHTDDGDLFGGDLPSWFNELFGHHLLSSLAQRRGECIHGACPHYQRCFVETSIRRAQQADIVIANHALVINQISRMQPQEEATDQPLPTRYIFDEGHHLLDAADKAYSVALSGIEGYELRRWLLGAEGAKSRSKGLRRRIEDLIVGNPSLENPLEEALLAAHILPNVNWLTKIVEPPSDNVVKDENPYEAFISSVYKQILARSAHSEKTNGWLWHKECDLFPPLSELTDAAKNLVIAIDKIIIPLRKFINQLEKTLEKESTHLDKLTQDRIETLIASIQHRALNPLINWLNLLHLIIQPLQEESSTYIDFLSVTRHLNGKIEDIGLYHHWIDPTLPLMSVLGYQAHGMLITSATLRDEGNNNTEDSWNTAECRVGTVHLNTSPIRAALGSPFDYAEQARVYIITDVNQNSLLSLASAYRTLFMASKGGGLGLFTAIHRLRAVYQEISKPLEQAGIPLFAQHIDLMNNASLVDLFRIERHSCLLGTDAMRDGIDIPGEALRLVVFERVPWPRPDILHRERRRYFSASSSPRSYDEQIARLKLRQAFGRLIRSKKDRGVFVILDRRTPTRLLSAFPKEVPIERLPLEEAVLGIQAFYDVESNNP